MIAYSFDAAGRLIGSLHGDHAHRYSVDAAGNRLAPQDNQQSLPDNRLTQLNGARYRYDGANRLVHLIHASELGATREATYRYDGLGRRISKTVRHANGTTANTHYGWDGDRIVREETDHQRTTVVYEPDSFVPLLRIDDTQQGQVLSAYVTDALGTPMQLVNAQGDTAWQAQPDDWAAIKNERGHTAQPIRFQGQWHDEESGLYYNRHRYYDPQQGRYISQDPIGLNGGVNLYGYVTNPTGMVDPLGLSPRLSKVWVVEQGVCYVGTQARDTMQEQVGEIDNAWGAVNEQNRQNHERYCGQLEQNLRSSSQLSREEISQRINSCMDNSAREENRRNLEITEEIRDINAANEPTTSAMRTLLSHCDFPATPPWSGRR